MPARCKWTMEKIQIIGRFPHKLNTGQGRNIKSFFCDLQPKSCPARTAHIVVCAGIGARRRPAALSGAPHRALASSKTKPRDVTSSDSWSFIPVFLPFNVKAWVLWNFFVLDTGWRQEPAADNELFFSTQNIGKLITPFQKDYIFAMSLDSPTSSAHTPLLPLFWPYLLRFVFLTSIHFSKNFPRGLVPGKINPSPREGSYRSMSVK